MELWPLIMSTLQWCDSLSFASSPSSHSLSSHMAQETPINYSVGAAPRLSFALFAMPTASAQQSLLVWRFAYKSVCWFPQFMWSPANKLENSFVQSNILLHPGHTCREDVQRKISHWRFFKKEFTVSTMAGPIFPWTTKPLTSLHVRRRKSQKSAEKSTCKANHRLIQHILL